MFSYIRRHFHPLWRLRKHAWYRWFQKKVDFPVSVRRGGVRFWVMLLRDFAFVAPNRGMEVEAHGAFEKIITGLGITHVLDVGANVGTFAWHSYDLNKELEIYLFEPDPTNQRLLKRTIRRNGMTRIHLWEGVVSNTTGPIEFMVDEASGAAGSIKDSSSNPLSLHAAYAMSRKVAVQSTVLDAYVDRLGTPGGVLVKIDVEGAEREVLEGARAFIRRFRPMIIIECFHLENLSPLADLAYVTHRLDELGNYLLLPSESADLCVRRGVIAKLTPVA